MPELPQNEVDFLREKLSFLEAELSAKDAALSAKDADLETITARLKKKESDYDLLVQRHMELQRNQFGRKTERFVDDENPQASLFPVEFDSNDPNPNPDDIETITYQRQKGGKRRSLDMSDLPKREVELLVDQKDRVCS
ncbi:hypothetical protein EBR57_07440, partial [bacterium]|nr:hypothetical protein [bacterium]